MMTSFTQTDLDQLRLDLSLQAKNGLNFIGAATVVWLFIAYAWTLPYDTKTKCFITFYIGGLMLPLAWLIGKPMRTVWNMPNNPLQPLGLWLNVAQLAYFPILFFVLSKYPEHFIMIYAIITGAHFFPYGWFYNTKSFAVIAIFISVGATWLGLSVTAQALYIIPLFMSASLIVLAGWLVVDYQRKKRQALLIA